MYLLIGTFDCTTLLRDIVAQFAHAGYSCAFVDASDCFDPMDAEAAGVELHRVLWIRCDQDAGTQQYKTKQKWNKIASRHHRYEVYGYKINGTCTTTNTGGHKLLNPLEQAFKAADILVQNGEFRLITVDLSNIDWQLLRKVPFTTWFRFARVARKTQTALIFLMSCPVAHSSADVIVQMSLGRACWSNWTEHSAEMAESVRTNKCEVQENSINKKPESGNELFTPSEQFPILVNQTKYENPLGTPLKKKGSSRGREHAIHESNNCPISSHVHLLEGTEREVQIRRQKKPVQRVRPGFTAISNWK